MDVEQYRQRQYAVHTLALGDGDVPGAASLFDSALTNGLLAIVAKAWPGEDTHNDRTLSAKLLVDLIISKTGTSDWLIAEYEGLLFDETRVRVEVDLHLLRQALAETQPVRHGRAGGTEVIDKAVVRALRSLDAHDALSVLTDMHIDQAEVAAATVRAVEGQRVARYIDLIGYAEVDRRAERAADVLPIDPKERSAHLGLGDCPMCGRESLVVEGELDYGTQLGTCVACSFVYTEEMADDAELRRMLDYHAGE